MICSPPSTVVLLYFVLYENRTSTVGVEVAASPIAAPPELELSAAVCPTMSYGTNGTSRYRADHVKNIKKWDDALTTCAPTQRSSKQEQKILQKINTLM